MLIDRLEKKTGLFQGRTSVLQAGMSRISAMCHSDTHEDTNHTRGQLGGIYSSLSYKAMHTMFGIFALFSHLLQPHVFKSHGAVAKPHLLHFKFFIDCCYVKLNLFFGLQFIPKCWIMCLPPSQELCC